MDTGGSRHMCISCRQCRRRSVPPSSCASNRRDAVGKPRHQLPHRTRRACRRRYRLVRSNRSTCHACKVRSYRCSRRLLCVKHYCPLCRQQQVFAYRYNRATTPDNRCRCFKPVPEIVCSLIDASMPGSIRLIFHHQQCMPCHSCSAKIKHCFRLTHGVT